MTYLFGVDVPLTEIILVLVLIFFIVLIFTIFSAIKARKQQRKILEILMTLEEKEIDELNKLAGLSSKEKHFIKEVKASKKTGVNVVLGSGKEKGKIASSIFEKFIGSPEVKSKLLKSVKKSVFADADKLTDITKKVIIIRIITTPRKQPP